MVTDNQQQQAATCLLMIKCMPYCPDDIQEKKVLGLTGKTAVTKTNS